ADEQLASVTIIKQRSGVSPFPVTTTSLYQQLKWRFLWPIDPNGSCWNYVRLRWREGTWSTPYGESESLTSETAQLAEIAWNRTVQGNYNPLSMETWPRTAWRETPMPAIDPPPDPDVPNTDWIS